MHWLLMQMTICALKFSDSDRFTKSIFVVDEADRQKRLKQMNSDRFHWQACSTTMVGRSLIMVKASKPNTVTKYDNLKNLKMLRECELEPMANEEEVWCFILTPFKDRFMLFTGGAHLKTDLVPMPSTHLLDITTGKWLKSPGQPDMNDARSFHSSCTTKDQAFVFFGWNSSIF